MPPQKRKHKKLYNWVKKSTTKNPNKTPRNKQTPLKEPKQRNPATRTTKTHTKGRTTISILNGWEGERKEFVFGPRTSTEVTEIYFIFS